MRTWPSAPPRPGGAACAEVIWPLVIGPEPVAFADADDFAAGADKFVLTRVREHGRVWVELGPKPFAVRHFTDEHPALRGAIAVVHHRVRGNDGVAARVLSERYRRG